MGDFIYKGWEMVPAVLWLMSFIGLPFVLAHDISKILGSPRLRADREACVDRYNEMIRPNQRSGHLQGLLYSVVGWLAFGYWVYYLGTN